MMKILSFSVLLLCLNAHADQHYATIPHNGKLYLDLNACPGKCQAVGDPDGKNVDMEIMAVSGGLLVVDPAKRAARDAALASAAAAEQTRREQLIALKEKAEAGTLTAIEQREVFKHMLRMLAK